MASTRYNWAKKKTESVPFPIRTRFGNDFAENENVTRNEQNET